MLLYPGLKELIDNMFETLYRVRRCRTGCSSGGTLIYVWLLSTFDVLSEEYPEYKDFRRAYINPHIVEV